MRKHFDMIDRRNRDDAERGEQRPETADHRATAAALHPSSFILHPSDERASSLITTLLVLVVLSTIVVAFMQSMSVERNVAKSVKNALQAQLAADAGSDTAVERLKQLMTAYPYHAIGYTNIGGQTVTILAGSTNFNATAPPITNYLLSVTNDATPPPALNTSNSLALNALTPNTSRWIGSPVTNGAITSRECRAPWVYLLANQALPHQSDPAAANYNPYVARYAYWIEDESSKLNFRVAGNNNAGGGFQRSTNSNLPGDIDLGAAPVLNYAPIPTNNSSANSSLIAFRNSTTNLPVDGRILGQATNVSTNAAESSRFYVTMASYANDLAGTGQKRVNLNALVTDGIFTNSIASDLDDIGYSITGTHTYPGLNNATDQGFFHDLPATNGPMPDFGSRFYPGVTAANKIVYLKKVLANIRDYIDSDSQPTLVDFDGNVSTTVSTNWYNEWPPQALGKEAIPYLQETAWAGNEVSWSGTGSTRTATLEIDHYLEFYNPGTKDFVAPPGTTIAFSNMATWSGGSYPDLEIEDFSLDLSGVTFPAGKVTVITTNPGTDPANLISDASTVVRIAPAPEEGTRKFTNRTTDEEISSTKGFQLGYPARSSTVSDTESRLIMSGPQGIFDALPKYGFTAVSATPWNFKGLNVGDRTRFVYGASLSGNSADGRSGDPRSLSEQLQLQAFNSGNQDNTRFYGTIQGAAPPGSATFGKAASTFVDPTKNQGTTGAWGDYSIALGDTSSSAYAVIRDSPMVSIGELGNIYDPYRLASPTGINASRGGGRSLKVGQPDDVIGSATRFSSTWQNAAWRLADVFGVSTNRSQPEFDPVSRGKVNINSVARDGGTVLQGLLRNFVFLPAPDSDPSIAGKQLTSLEITRLIQSIANYISSNGPIMERGELSQISYFSGGTTNLSTLGGKTVRTTIDRGREEVFRRMIELITTRSSSFSVFSAGEALQESPSGVIKVLSKAKTGAVYRFDPLIDSAPRSKATGYTITKLYEIK